MANSATSGSEEVPMGIAFGAALVGALGPCSLGETRCPIQPGELHAPEKCQLGDCPRHLPREKRPPVPVMRPSELPDRRDEPFPWE